MKADFSRLTFDARGHYTRLPLQQGRVVVDADWNEQADIALHDRRVTRRAIIGPTGGPLEGAALRIAEDLFGDGLPGIAVDHQSTPALGEPYAKPGYYWVEGRTLTQHAAWSLAEQPHLTQDLPSDEGYYLAWVDVFERSLTALDVPGIREIALGGPDHGTRVQMVWQVRLWGFEPASAGDPTCVDVPAGWRPVAPTGRMLASVPPLAETENPCVVPAASGYRRLENQLYRIEIRQAGDDDHATFVFSRDNGIIRVRAVEGSYDGSGTHPTIQVEDLGRDELTQLAANQWIEITDAQQELQGIPGALCRIRSVTAKTLELYASSAISEADFDALDGPTVRRWDTVQESRHPVGAPYLDGAEYPVSAAVSSDPDTWFELEDGVRVQLRSGTYRTGDYWLVPARTRSGDVEFGDSAELPHGVEHFAARLAILHLAANGKWRLVSDCRSLFPALTRLTHLHYVGGDGQEAIPGALLPAALEVAVTNGSEPVEGVSIRFAVTRKAGVAETNTQHRAHGYLLDASATAPDLAAGQFELTVPTGPDGIAGVRWVLGDAPSNAWSQHVTATVVPTHATDPTGAIHFHANQSIAREVHVDLAPCPANEDDPALTTVQALLGVAGIDPGNPDHQQVQHVLHELLCRVHAKHIPYVFPATPTEIDPATVIEVKTALDALFYLAQNCGASCAQIIARLADALSGKAGEELCKALETAPVDGEASLLGQSLGMVLNLVRVVYIFLLALLDLQEAPGAGRGYKDLVLGDETGIELEAFIYNEGPAWFATYTEEKFDQIDALNLGDQLQNVLLVAFETWIGHLGIKDALQRLADEYGKEGEAWNGPATRLFILQEIWVPVFKSPRLDDPALQRFREIVLDAVRILWRILVDLLLCGEPVPERVPIPKWLPDVADALGRAFERGLGMHGLVRQLPEDRYGRTINVHMVPRSKSYREGATWAVALATSAKTGGDVARFLRWRHGDEPDGPLGALDDLPANRVLHEPDADIGMEWDDNLFVQYLDTAGRRGSLYVLMEVTGADGTTDVVLWLLSSSMLGPLDGRIVLGGTPTAPELGRGFSRAKEMPVGSTVLVDGGPDDPATVVGWNGDLDADSHLFVNAPLVGASLSVKDTALADVGLPATTPAEFFAFALDGEGGKPGRYIGLAVDWWNLDIQYRPDGTPIYGPIVERHVLLLLEASDHSVPWWRSNDLVPAGSWDLPDGIRVGGGGHDLIALNDVSADRWMLLRVADLVEGKFDAPDANLKSVHLTAPPDEAWSRGQVSSTAHGLDGPWLAVLGPHADRLGLYRAWTPDSPLQRQFLRGATAGSPIAAETSARVFAAVGGPALANAVGLGTSSQPTDATEAAALVVVAHDYLLQGPNTDTKRLLASLVASGDSTPVIEYHAAPRM